MNLRNIRHGHVFSPASRAYFAWKEGKIDQGALNQVEAGKFFPATQSGLKDPTAPTDDPSATPPRDGEIASGNQGNTLRILDEPGNHWKKHNVISGEYLPISWNYTAVHSTRRWNYFITKPDWDPQKVLSRSQFEEIPFYQVVLNHQPHWSHANELTPPNPTNHNVPLPERTGYHVLLAVWEVANTGNAFYQVIDLDFTSSGNEEKPERPTGLIAVDIKEKEITLKWNSSNGSKPIEKYRIIQNGTNIAEVYASAELLFTDRNLQSGTEYTYSITAIDIDNSESLQSASIKVRTLNEGGSSAPPSAPYNLHKMKVTETEIELMWGHSNGNNKIILYHIYRDGSKIAPVSAETSSYVDKNLKPDTLYEYFVVAEDIEQLSSPSSNVLSVKTKEQVSGSIPEWNFPERYEVGDKVTFEGKIYRCNQAHTSNEAWTPVATVRVLWLIHKA